MSSNTTTTTGATASTGAPWGPTQPFIQDIMQKGSDSFQAGYGNVAPLNPSYAQGLGGLDVNAAQDWASGRTQGPYNYALQQIQSGGIDPQTQGFLSNSVGPMALSGGADQFQGAKDIFSNIGNSPNENPFLSQLLDTNATRIGNRAASLSSGAGRYGSSGMYDALNRSIAETNNPILSQAYENDQNRRLQAAGGLSGIAQNINANKLGASSTGLGALAQAGNRAGQWAQMAPSLYNLSSAPLQGMADVGRVYQDRAQAISDAPWNNLARYGASVTGNAGLLAGTGTRTGSSNQVASTPTPWTTYAGLGLAGIGALSDRRLKTDITKLGKDPHTSLNMYAFRYKGDPKSYPKMVGPMAQEVQKKYPEAVGNVGGILYIKAA